MSVRALASAGACLCTHAHTRYTSQNMLRMHACACTSTKQLTFAPLTKYLWMRKNSQCYAIAMHADFRKRKDFQGYAHCAALKRPTSAHRKCAALPVHAM